MIKFLEEYNKISNDDKGPPRRDRHIRKDVLTRILHELFEEKMYNYQLII